MKGDFTRNTFSPERRYTGVRLQQGRVQIDADWNEQVDIAAERVRTGTRDVIGPAGGPLPTPGFEIVADASTLPAPVVAELTTRGLLPLAAGNVLIMPGRYYVDGVLIENPTATTLVAQPEGGGTALAEGRHLLYVDVWEQHLTFVEDERIREVALGGSDTASRTRLVWHVRSLPVSDAFHCLASDAGWDALVAGSTGRMAARAEPASVPVDPCVVPASAGYRGLQNRLYRVEIHAGSTLATATLKWSRDNGTVLFPVEEVNVGGSATRVRLRSLGRDNELSLRIGDYVEVLDDDNELSGTPGLLTEVADVDEDDLIVTLAAAVAGIDPGRHAKLRRWDSVGAVRVGPKRWIEIEDGVEVQFETGSYRTGDYWLIPARTILGNPLLVDGNGLDWPIAGGTPVARAPEGIGHRYARLAIVRRTTTATTREHDCRKIFPPLTTLEQLLYVSGDGQDGVPGKELPQSLAVRVARGQHPIKGVVVRFEIESGNGTLVGAAGLPLEVSTDDKGLATCRWELDADPRAEARYQRVRASLLDAAGQEILGQTVIFCATATETLHYVSGDGQEAPPGKALQHPLEVRVANGQRPVENARIRFTVQGGGGLSGLNPARTNADGMARIEWSLGNAGVQRVVAELVDETDNVVQHIGFNADFGESGCCTINVEPGESIQAAIDGLPESGGCVCLKAGLHPITATINLNRSNVHLHGETKGAEIRSPALVEALHIGGTTLARVHDVIVAHVRIVVDGSADGGVIVGMGNADRVVLRETELIVQYSGALPAGYCGVYADNSSDVVICDNVVQNVFYGAYIADVSVRAWVNDNRFIGLQYNLAALNISIGEVGIHIGSDVAGDYRAERNHIQHLMTGVQVPAGSQGAQVIGNRILRSAGAEEGSVPADAAALRAYLDKRFYGIDLAGGRCIAQGNRIEMESPQWGGIRVQTTGAVVADNTLIGNLSEGNELLPASIYCTSDAATGRSGSTCTISGNTLQGPQVGIVVSRVTGVSVLDNRVDGLARAWYGVRVDDASYTTVAGNLVAAVGLGCHLSEGDHNVVRDGRTAFCFIGVLAVDETDLGVHDNEVTGAVILGLALMFADGDLLVSRDRIVNCGWLSDGGGMLVLCSRSFEPAINSARIESCEVVEPGVAPDGTVSTTIVRGIHVLFTPNCQILGNRVVSTNQQLIASTLEHRALLMVGPLSYAPLAIATSSAVISNNVFRGPGTTHLVELPIVPINDASGLWFHKIVFTGNFCDHYAPSSTVTVRSTVLLSGRHVAASANQITAAQGMTSLNCAGSVRNSIVGNVTSGGIINFGIALPGPTPAAFNIIV